MSTLTSMVRPMSDSFLTVVFRDLTQDEVSELAYHPKVSALSWSHAIDERDILKNRHQRLLNETCDYAN